VTARTAALHASAIFCMSFCCITGIDHFTGGSCSRCSHQSRARWVTWHAWIDWASGSESATARECCCDLEILLSTPVQIMLMMILIELSVLVNHKYTHLGTLEHTGKCCICLSERVSFACSPCGHVCFCAECAADCVAACCPICRAPSPKVIRLYF